MYQTPIPANLELEKSFGPYWTQLRKDIKLKSTIDGGLPNGAFEEEVFIERMCDLLEEKGELDGFQIARWKYAPPGEPIQMKMDACYIEESLDGAPPTEATIIISDWHNRDIVQILPSDELTELEAAGCELLRRAIEDLELTSYLEPSQEHTDFLRMLQENREALQKIRLLIVSNRVAEGDKEKELQCGDIKIDLHVWDLQKFSQLEFGRRVSGEEIVIDLNKFGGPLPCIPAPATPLYQSYLAVVPATTLKEIYNVYGPRLLEANVRAFLQVTNQVNHEIRQTIINHPSDFFAYNNGLSATAECVELGTSQGQLALTSIRGLQIVNGAQTTGSLHRAAVHDGASLDEVFVPMKLTCVNPEHFSDLVPKISRFANSQSTVNTADFSANHKFFIQVERLSRQVSPPQNFQYNWFFERARGQYESELDKLRTKKEQEQFLSSNPKDKLFTKTDIATFIYTWEGKPYFVSLGAQKNFGKFRTQWIESYEKTNQTIDQTWYKKLIAKAILFRRTRHIVNENKDIEAYRSNIIGYTISLLSYHTDLQFDLLRVWENQDISDELADLIDSWSVQVHKEIVATAGTRNVTEWAKKKECWDALRAQEFTFSFDGIPEILKEPIVFESVSLTKKTKKDQTTTISKVSGLKVSVAKTTIESKTNDEYDEDKETKENDAKLTSYEHEVITVRALLINKPLQRDDLLRGIAKVMLNKKRLGKNIRERAKAILDKVLGIGAIYLNEEQNYQLTEIPDDD